MCARALHTKLYISSLHANNNDNNNNNNNNNNCNNIITLDNTVILLRATLTSGRIHLQGKE